MPAGMYVRVRRVVLITVAAQRFSSVSRPVYGAEDGVGKLLEMGHKGRAWPTGNEPAPGTYPLPGRTALRNLNDKCKGWSPVCLAWPASSGGRKGEDRRSMTLHGGTGQRGMAHRNLGALDERVVERRGTAGYRDAWNGHICPQQQAF